MGEQPESAGLVERDEHLAQLVGAVETSMTGEGSLALIEGPPGIGKTGLLAACHEHSEAAGMRVLSARCRELESDFTHGVARQLFERTVLAASGAERERLLAGPAARAAETIAAEDPALRHLVPGDSDFAAIHGLYWLAANLAAERPLLLSIDDAQWADAASLRFLAYLTNRLPGLSLMTVVATRPRAASGDPSLLDELAAHAEPVLRLGVLSAAGSAEVVRRRTGGSAAFAAACHDASGGNPFLLHELLNALAADGIGADDAAAGSIRRLGPQSVSRAVFLRMARLPEGATAFARAVAVLGDRVELRDAAALAAIGQDEASRLSDALADAGVLASEVPLRFIHPVILEAITADLGPGERTAMHARAATVLFQRGAAADQVAAHLTAAGPLGEPWAIDVLRQAARAATASGATEVALRHLHHALLEDMPGETRGALLAELGEAEWLAAMDPRTVIGHLAEACSLTTDPVVLVQATIMLARATFTAGDIQGAAHTVLAALEDPRDIDHDGLMRLEAELGSIALLNLDLMPEAHRRLLALRERVPADTRELALLGNLTILAWMDQTVDEVGELAWRTLGDGRLLAALGSDTMAYLQPVWVLLGCDRLDEARVVCEAGLVDARERGAAFGFVACCVLAAMTAYRAGDLRECEAHLQAGIELGEVPLFLRPALNAYLALALVERGELEQAERRLEDGLVGPYLPTLAQMNIGFYARGILRAAQGRDEEALADLREFGTREAHCHVENASVSWRAAAVRACLRLGLQADAEQLAAEGEAVARRWGAPASIGNALRARAAAGGDIELLEAAVNELATSPCDLDRAHALLDLGMAERRAGRRSAAQRHLIEALELGRNCGAAVLTTRANEELAVAGARPRRLQFSGADSLTASERRVAMMAAEGLSNPQIAQALFITAKTVENHLGRVYIKLSINSRGQLAGALEDPSGDEPAVVAV